MSKKKSFWPIGIALSIVGVIALSVATVMVALKNPVQMDNDHMSAYKHIDRNINDIINDNIAFNRLYTIEFLNEDFVLKAFVPKLRVVDKKGQSVQNVEFEILFTRPDEVNHDIKAKLASNKEGMYTFEAIDFPLKGRWNIFIHAKVGDKKGYLRLKLDSRYPKDRTPFETVLPME